jgi:hypothetical protein
MAPAWNGKNDEIVTEAVFVAVAMEGVGHGFLLNLSTRNES